MSCSEVRLGRTEARVHPVGVGTWGFGGPQVVRGQAEGWGGAEEHELRAALLEAHDLGLRHWDTADAYGRGRVEELIGSLWPGNLPRDDVFLATKVGHAPLDGRHPYEPAHLRAQVEASLRRLRTGHVDACYLHHCDFGPDDARLDGAVETMNALRLEGRVRHVGLSDWDHDRVATVARRADPDLVQVPRNVAEDRHRGSALAAWAEGADVGVVFFSPLKHGLLTGRRPPAFDPGDFRGRLPEFADPDVLDALASAGREVAARLDRPLLHALLAPLLDAPRNAVLVGLRRPRHVRAAAALSDAAALDERTADWVRERFAAALLTGPRRAPRRGRTPSGP